MKALITVVCSLAVGLSYGAKIPFGDDGFGDNRNYNKTILRANGGNSCHDNEYDNDQYCKCKPGQRISTFKSEHSNGHEDRKWTLECSPIPGNPRQQEIMPSFTKIFESPFGGATSDMEFDVEKVLPLDHAGQSCWGQGLSQAVGYNYQGCQKKAGICNYCGKDGMCCRKGQKEGECLANSATANHHGCVATTGSGIDNSGRECWSNCNKSNGKCSWCGSKGVCCRKGVRVVGTECDGEIGGDGHHRCVAESESYVGFIVGMQSFHFRKYHIPHPSRWIEDRIYSFFWQHIPDWKLVDCEYKLVNNYDKLVDYTVLEDQVIAGVKSTYDWKDHDRKFTLKVCSLEPRCSQLFSIKYFPENAGAPMTSKIEAGYMSKNNLRHPVAGEYTVKLQDNLSSKVAREYSYARTEGDTMTASLEVSTGVNWGIGIGAEGSASITAGFEATWSTTETWSRSNRQEITETDGTEVSFTVTCPKNKFCESHIMMTHGEVKIPYEIIAYTKGEKDDTCSEKGVVTVSNSWQATITNAAYDRCDCNAENTELQTDGSFDCSAIDGKCTCKAGWTTYDCGIPVLAAV